MKKFLLFLLLASVSAIYAMADTAVFDFTGETAYGMEIQSDGSSAYNPDPTVCPNGLLTLTIDGKSRWWQKSGGAREVRFYKDSKITIAIAEGYYISKITLTGSRSFSGEGFSGQSWTGSADSVTLNCTVSSGNTPLTLITVEYAQGDPTGETGETEVKYGRYEPTTTIADGKYLFYAGVADTIATPIAATSNYGYLLATKAVPVADGSIVTLKEKAFTLTAVEGGYTITDETGRYYYMTGTYNSFNVSAERVDGDLWTIAATDEGTVVITNVAMEKSLQYDPNYKSFGAYPDVRGAYPVLYKFVADADAPAVDPEPVVPTVADLKEANAMANNDKFKMGADVTVVYANGAYVYVYDGNDYGLVYKRDLGLNAGDVIAKGWEGKVSIYNKLVELVPTSDLTVSATGAALPEPLEVEGDDASILVTAGNQNVYMQLLGVSFAEATPAADAASDARNFTGTMGDVTVTFYQRFGVDSVLPGTYNVTGFVSVYGDRVQFFPTSIVPAAGISSVVSDSAAARYYNLQGVEIADPLPGNIYIRICGGQASKVIK